MPYQIVNVETIKIDNEIIMKSPDGTEWKLAVDNQGNLAITKAA